VIGGRGEDWTRFLLLFLVLEAFEQRVCFVKYAGEEEEGSRPW